MSKDNLYKDKTIPPKNIPLELSRPEIIPERVGLYKIESLFEKGGMSVLYLGTHTETFEPAIIKVLPQKYLSNKEIVKRFLNEADIISLADHPNIVKLYSHGEWEGGLYIAIEFVQGISLRQYILQHYITLKRAVEMTIEISYALCHLHMHGIIHRDLKPENILVPEQGPIKVIDFGIAERLTDEGAEKNDQDRTFIGTPIYMSPEQKKNPQAVSYPSDIYSLGIIFYELVLGKLSFGQIHVGMMPKGLRKILAKALQLDPKERYQDVVDFIADISNYLNSPAIKEEQNIGDHISELSENLRNNQLILLPNSAPLWKGLEIGIATHKESSPFGLQQGLYQDFFEIQTDAFGVIMTDSSLKKRESFIYTAATRGMIRALCKLTTKPDEFVTILNDLIVNDPLKHELSLNYITLEPKDNLFHYISCGPGSLFYHIQNQTSIKKIDNQNPSLGHLPLAEFNSIELSLDLGDLLLLCSFSGAILKENEKNQNVQKEIENCLAENHSFSAKLFPQKILKRLKIIFSKIIYDSVVSIIAIKRVD